MAELRHTVETLKAKIFNQTLNVFNLAYHVDELRETASKEPFTIMYLGNDPVMEPEVYAKTSPMTYIKNAKTPTLIQHGELDRRVPIANAYELRQGLEDRGVPVEMVVYKGFGHGITKPKAMRAVMSHNLAWFNHYLFGEAKPDLAKPDVQRKDEPAKAAGNR